MDEKEILVPPKLLHDENSSDNWIRKSTPKQVVFVSICSISSSFFFVRSFQRHRYPFIVIGQSIIWLHPFLRSQLWFIIISVQGVHMLLLPLYQCVVGTLKRRKASCKIRIAPAKRQTKIWKLVLSYRVVMSKWGCLMWVTLCSSVCLNRVSSSFLTTYFWIWDVSWTGSQLAFLSWPKCTGSNGLLECMHASMKVHKRTSIILLTCLSSPSWETMIGNKVPLPDPLRTSGSGCALKIVSRVSRR